MASLHLHAQAGCAQGMRPRTWAVWPGADACAAMGTTGCPAGQDAGCARPSWTAPLGLPAFTHVKLTSGCWRAVQALAGRHPELVPLQARLPWAVAMAHSRSFVTQVNGRLLHVMTPGIDFVNHSHQPCAIVKCGPPAAARLLRAISSRLCWQAQRSPRAHAASTDCSTLPRRLLTHVLLQDPAQP